MSESSKQSQSKGSGSAPAPVDWADQWADARVQEAKSKPTDGFDFDLGDLERESFMHAQTVHGYGASVGGQESANASEHGMKQQQASSSLQVDPAASRAISKEDELVAGVQLHVGQPEPATAGVSATNLGGSDGSAAADRDTTPPVHDTTQLVHSSSSFTHTSIMHPVPA